MSVVCAACGRTSRDREFCDHCNADLQPARDRQAPLRCPLPGSDVELSAVERHALARVQDAITLTGDAARWRVHWVPDCERERWRPHLEDRLSLDLEVLPPCRIIEVTSGQWVMSQTTAPEACPWHDRDVFADPLQRMRAMVSDVASLAHTLAQLERHGRVWLTFDPAAIEDAGPLSPPAAPDNAEPGLRLLRITNLDLHVHRIGECPESFGVNAKFAPPEVCAFRAADIGPASDVYHLAMFAYYWCARLLPQGFGGDGLDAFGHKLPGLRIYTPDLPEGIVPAILRGLVMEPRQRYRSAGEFVGALRAGVAEAERRRRGTGRLRWDAAALTDAGRSKDAIGKGNEDHLLLREFSTPRGALAAVADGISTCDIGSGALASLIASIVIENSFAEGTNHELFAVQAASACERGSRQILDWALEKGYRDQLALGFDLMGTTLTVAWIEGRQLSLANLGDSRAYLITADWVEQLTVDADLGTELLAAGAPPEQVLRMGIVAKALRGCVGGCTVNAGHVDVLPESVRPAVTRWPLAAGDVIVLCSDGLVEEGYFLEPEMLAGLVQSQHALPAAELARRLVDAANGMQRLPTLLEPEGFGDNITCVVIKIEADD